ncbi:DUF397 domain-containing protein [Sphaerisporangium sp. NPDC005288]|uniref:DUF397 domain-containing protein n=1 Tax=Sphaerisporangium rhizosphaerae TaxID=2269375 RepID=A0ABW2NZF5_9ACTN
MDLSHALWRKSSRSGDNGGHCVEVASNLAGEDAIAVRDSKNPDGPALVVASGEWSTFVNTLKAGRVVLGPIMAAAPATTAFRRAPGRT